MEIRKRANPKVMIDIHYLLNQTKIISKEEYKGRLINQPYSHYLEIFYKRRILEVFNIFFRENWFIQRYLTKRDSDVCNDFKSKLFVVIRDVASDLSHEKSMSDLIKTHSGSIENFFISQRGFECGFKRDYFLNINENINADGLINALDLPNKSNIINTNDFEIPWVDLPLKFDSYKNILKSLCFLYKKNFDEIFSSIKLDSSEEKQKILEITKLLQEKFLFCPVCCFQYDNKIDMLISCSKHSINDFCYRNIEILAEEKYLNDSKYYNSGREWDSYYFKHPDSIYECRECHKKFGEFEFLEKHLLSKHPFIKEEIDKNQEDFANFCSKIDMFILGIIEGTFDKTTPFYARPLATNHQVVYDYPRLFSGEIVFDK